MVTLNRRKFLGSAATAGAAVAGGLPLVTAATGAGLNLPAALPQGLRDNAIMDTLPGKKPLIKLSYRPPNYETPIEYFRTAITPNDAFYVRYHNAVIPEVDAKTWKVSIGGEGANSPIEINLDDLKKLPAVEIAAVNQCSGNRRGLFAPHVAGVEWGYGAMGCARWKGARLKGYPRQGRAEERSHRDRVERRRWTGCLGTRFRQEHSSLEGDGGDDPYRL